MPFRFEVAASAAPAGMQVRSNVDAGTNVISLADMLAGLEAGAGRKRPGEGRLWPSTLAR